MGDGITREQNGAPLMPAPTSTTAQLAHRRLDPVHHVRKIVALSEIYGTDATARALDDAFECGLWTFDVVDLTWRAAIGFPDKKAGRPFSDSALLGLLRRLRLPGTVHGFRSSFRDWVAETDAGTDQAAERALAHASTNQTVAAYLRTDLLEVRRPLMQRWAAHVTSAASV